MDLCERIIDDGHELNIFSDESAIVYGLENNLLDCFLLNNMEEIRFGDSLVNLQQKYQQVLFMVLEKHSANTTSLRKHDELFQDLNQENIEYVSNRINSYKPVPNVLENSKVVHAAKGKMRVLVVDDVLIYKRLLEHISRKLT